MDANAWGLFTHVYFAQSILLAVPMLDNRFRQIIKQFPEHVMAGACLPDLAVVAKEFKTTHQWKKAEILLESAETDEQLAVAIGYVSHLYVDVIAHNHFVPAHEAMWLDESIFTHIASEWAMDAHIAKHILHTPSKLLYKHAEMISHFIAPTFNQPQKYVKNKLTHLAHADRLLRFVQLPSLINVCVQWTRSHRHHHFNYYIEKTMHALGEFDKALIGHRPNWEPEQDETCEDYKMVWRVKCLEQLRNSHAIPISYYQSK
jgi:hypothetical protein